MPSISAYSTIGLDDEDTISAWLLAHRARHQSYAYAVSRQGYQITNYDFSQYPDDTWYGQHTSIHQYLLNFAVPDQSVDPTVLSNLTWDMQDDFDTWMRMHTLMHQRLDEAFQMFS